MLKIRNLIFALGLSPLTLAVWQLPSQAGGPPPGTESGNNNTGTTITIFSAPPAALPGGTTTTGGTTAATTTTGATVSIPIIPGVSASITTGVSSTGDLPLANGAIETVAISGQSLESNASSITVTNSTTGNSVVISLPPIVQATVNQLAAAIAQNINQNINNTTGGTTGGGTTGGGTAAGATAVDIGALVTGGAGSQQAAVALTNSFTAAGISPQLATALVTSLSGLFGSTSASLPNQPVAMTTSGQLVASTKAFKPVTIIAQGSAGISVNINKLNDAIVAYNAIVLQSKPEAVKNLSNNTGFRGIGGILKQLRTAIK
ncbi:MAG: hypothetical protein H9534_18740 [Dolichospermum circinale Clear-D4]|nr:hypothetical protein [Dolichospermum circinale Clear-D4]